MANDTQRYGVLTKIEVPTFIGGDPIQHVVMQGLTDQQFYMNSTMLTFGTMDYDGVDYEPKPYTKEAFVEAVKTDAARYHDEATSYAEFSGKSYDTSEALAQVDATLKEIDGDLTTIDELAKKGEWDKGLGAEIHASFSGYGDIGYLNYADLVVDEVHASIRAVTKTPDLEDRDLMNTQVQLQSEMAKMMATEMRPSTANKLSHAFGTRVIEPAKDLKFKPSTMESLVELDSTLKAAGSSGIESFAPDSFTKYAEYVASKSTPQPAKAAEHKPLFNKQAQSAPPEMEK